MWDFGRVDVLEPEAIGEPGNRTFRLKVLRGADSASLWMEKEHLIALAMAVRQVLEQLEDDQFADTEPGPLAITFPQKPTVEFKIARLGIGFDEEQDILTIYAYSLEAEEDSPPTFSCQISRDQSRDFAERAENVISAGRPICLVCGGPINPEGHQCQRRNGHSEHPITLE
jgi:uncharacterized repeat protein (TIGR03847 family)